MSKMLFLISFWIFSSLAVATASNPRPVDSSCGTKTDEHEQTTLLQSRAAPKAKPRPAARVPAPIPAPTPAPEVATDRNMEEESWSSAGWPAPAPEVATDTNMEEESWSSAGWPAPAPEVATDTNREEASWSSAGWPAPAPEAATGTNMEEATWSSVGWPAPAPEAATGTNMEEATWSPAGKKGVVSIRLASELQVSADHAGVAPAPVPTPAPAYASISAGAAADVASREYTSFLSSYGITRGIDLIKSNYHFLLDLVKASAADTSPHQAGMGATPAPTLVSVSSAASKIAKTTAELPSDFSDSSFPAMIHKSALVQFDLCRALCQKYDPWRSDALLITMMLIFLGAFCFGFVICCLQMHRTGTRVPLNSMSHTMNAPPPRPTQMGPTSTAARNRLSPLTPQDQTPPAPPISPAPPPIPVEAAHVNHTTYGSPGGGWQSRFMHSSPSPPQYQTAQPSPMQHTAGGRSEVGRTKGSLNADLVLPDDKEVLLAVPSLAFTPPSDKPVEHPIANKDGAPILRLNMSRRLQAGGVCERLYISLWEDGVQLSYCELWPDRVQKGASQGNLHDAVVGSIFRNTGETFANIIRHYTPSAGGGLPVGEFLVKSPSAPSWQHRMQSKGRDLMVVDMSGHPHGVVMSGIDLSFEDRNVQYYQLHALAGTDVCLLLMTVLSIDRLTLLSKQ